MPNGEENGSSKLGRGVPSGRARRESVRRGGENGCAPHGVAGGGASALVPPRGARTRARAIRPWSSSRALPAGAPSVRRNQDQGRSPLGSSGRPDPMPVGPRCRGCATNPIGVPPLSGARMACRGRWLPGCRRGDPGGGHPSPGRVSGIRKAPKPSLEATVPSPVPGAGSLTDGSATRDHCFPDPVAPSCCRGSRTNRLGAGEVPLGQGCSRTSVVARRGCPGEVAWRLARRAPREVSCADALRSPWEAGLVAMARMAWEPLRTVIHPLVAKKPNR